MHIQMFTSCMLCVSVCGDEEPWSLVPWTVWSVLGGRRLSTVDSTDSTRRVQRGRVYGAHTSRLTLLYICIYGFMG
jgi:hypothetical protein